MMAPIFKDPELQARFERDGYVKIKLLDREKAKLLYDFYIQHQAEHAVVGSRYQATTHTNNPELILQINKQIKSVLAPELGNYFQNYEPMMCTYIAKEPGEGSETKLHQDPTFVDENKYVSANVWVALHDIDHNNGNLFVIKGTQSFRSLRVTPNCPTAYDNVKDLLQENLTEIPVSAGEAIVINHATVHGATPNYSNGPRVAAVMAIRSAESEWIYHYLEPGAPYDKIEQYSVNLDTFVNLQKDGRPEKGTLKGYISWGFPQIDRTQFVKNIQSTKNPSSETSWFTRLVSLKEKILS